MTAVVVLTRPKGRNENLAKMLSQNENVQVMVLPALQLTPKPSALTKAHLPSNYNLIVVVSSLAASIYVDFLKSNGVATWPKNTYVAAVGASSANPLHTSGLIPESKILHPYAGSRSQDSEELWNSFLSSLKNINNALILRGQTGREWLSSQLQAAGITVSKLSIYKRERNIWSQSEISKLSKVLSSSKQTVFLITSSESAMAIKDSIIQANLMKYWVNCSFITIHKRITEHLRTILHTEGLTA